MPMVLLRSGYRSAQLLNPHVRFMLRQKTKIAFLVFSIAALTLPFISFAADPATPAPTATSNPNNQPIGINGFNPTHAVTKLICADTDKLSACLPKIYDFVFLAAGIAAILLLIFYGYNYMSAGGNGKQLGEARKQLQNLGYGVLLLLMSFVILQFLNPSFTDLKETPLDIPVNGLDINAHDITAPAVITINPKNDTQVTGTVEIAVTATDNVKVTKVTFLVDDKAVGEVTDGVFKLPWNTATVTEGAHHIITKAYDAAGNVATAASITVTVKHAR
jgi:hypothetical protein